MKNVINKCHECNRMFDDHANEMSIAEDDTCLTCKARRCETCKEFYVDGKNIDALSNTEKCVHCLEIEEMATF